LIFKFSVVLFFAGLVFLVGVIELAWLVVELVAVEVPLLPVVEAVLLLELGGGVTLVLTGAEGVLTTGAGVVASV
jgi:hypothetical protein